MASNPSISYRKKMDTHLSSLLDDFAKQGYYHIWTQVSYYNNFLSDTLVAYDIVIIYCLFDCGFGPFPDTQINHGRVFPIELQWASCDIKTFPQNASLHVHLTASIPT